jgi:hypothetical protein
MAGQFLDVNKTASGSDCHIMRTKSVGKIVHCGEHVDVGLLGCNAVWTCRQTLAFRRKVLFASLGLKSVYYPLLFTVSQINFIVTV